ncbi:MAG: DUF4406 domain-containing protein [Candidatus Paceibacterota bacterium]|jgi:hypothetical protein
MRKRVYIAGPISDENCINVAANLHRFAECENALLQAGFAPFNPAADWDAVRLGGTTYEMLMERDLSFIPVCDVLYFLRGWKHSAGANREYRAAQKIGIPCAFEPIEGFEFSEFAEIDAEDWSHA